MSNRNQEKKNNKWLALMGIPFQMGAIIFAFCWFGMWLDERTGNENLYLIVFSLVSVAIALYNVIRQVNNLNKK